MDIAKTKNQKPKHQMTTEAKTTGKRGQIKLTALPFDSDVTCNALTLPFTFVPSGRQPEGTPEDKPVAGYLGISPKLSATYNNLIDQLEDFLTPEKYASSPSDKALWHSKFQELILDYINLAYCKPAWDVASLGFPAKSTIPVESQPDVIEKFVTELRNIINQTKERQKSSIQWNAALSEHTDTILKPLQRDLKALLDTLKIDLKTFLAKPDKTEGESSLLARFSVAQKEQKNIKEQIQLAKEREAEIERRANKDLAEMDAFLAELGDLNEEIPDKE